MKFDNTIDELLLEAQKYEKLHKCNPHFISDWNPSSENLKAVHLKSNNVRNVINNYNYLYSIDDIDYKENFKKYCNKKSYNYELLNFSLFSNSTITLYLIFKSLKMHSKNNILVFTPCYFTSDSALLSLEFNVYFFSFINNCINEDSIISIIKERKINAILITDPIYGIGVSISYQTYKILINVAKKLNVTLIIDYSYGNMIWDEKEHIFNYNLISMLAHSGINYYVVDSLPKKLFLNGVKFSLLFSNLENISYIENLSLFVEGSITSEQFKNYYKCYDEKNSNLINTIINDYIHKAQNTYNLIQSLLLDCKTLKLEYANSGVFALVGMQRRKSIKEDMNFSKLLIKKHGIFVTPHSRYRFYDDSWFYFRINLLLNKEVLLESLTKMSSL